jgi:type VI secretion system secreted protein VgrG
MQLSIASSPQSLESRIAHLESVLKPSNNTITLQVGTSKVVISSDKIELVCQGTIQIKAIKVNVDSQADIDIRASGNLSERASSTLTVQAGGTLNLKGATINQN